MTTAKGHLRRSSGAAIMSASPPIASARRRSWIDVVVITASFGCTGGRVIFNPELPTGRADIP
jgi:hypothetical protein